MTVSEGKAMMQRDNWLRGVREANACAEAEKLRR